MIMMVMIPMKRRIVMIFLYLTLPQVRKLERDLQIAQRNMEVKIHLLKM